MIAESAGASAEVVINTYGPVTFNDPGLTNKMIPTFERVAGKKKVFLDLQKTGAEDFAFSKEKVPGLFFFLRINPEGSKVISSHSPNFFVDERAIIVGIRAMANLAVDCLAGK